MKKRKFKLKSIILLAIVLVIGAIAIIGVTQFQNIVDARNDRRDRNTLLEKGYSEEDIETIFEHPEMRVMLLEREFNEFIIETMLTKYYIPENLEAYLEFKAEIENRDRSIAETIAMVNVGAHREWYDGVRYTDLGKDTLKLVNKFYQLPEDFRPENLVRMSIQHAFNDNFIRKDIEEKFGTMAAEGRENGIRLVANSAFRDFQRQDALWSNGRLRHGQAWADNWIARAGHSEHQTGLALDISTYPGRMEDFAKTPEYAWLIENGHRFGFILRYPEDKEHITGYLYEPWHWRYVGIEVATYIKENNITFDEYYAYYLNR